MVVYAYTHIYMYMHPHINPSISVITYIELRVLLGQRVQLLPEQQVLGRARRENQRELGVVAGVAQHRPQHLHDRGDARPARHRH